MGNTQILACNLDCRHGALRESMTRGIDSYPGQFGNPPGVRFSGDWYKALELASRRRPQYRVNGRRLIRRPPNARPPAREVPRTSRQRSDLAAARGVSEVLLSLL